MTHIWSEGERECVEVLLAITRMMWDSPLVGCCIRSTVSAGDLLFAGDFSLRNNPAPSTRG